MSLDFTLPETTQPSQLPPHQPAPETLTPGTRFGEFEIQRVLGIGGFGIVYLAHDHSLDRAVALKEYMPAALAARTAGTTITVRSQGFADTYAVGLRSFMNEAKLLARFDHPSLVKVYRFWEGNGTAYMVMPYLPGQHLRDVRKAMNSSPDETWLRRVLNPILDALEQLHREGVFHRDIAPDNILLTPEGTPVLLDFGAARRVIEDRTQTLTAILKPSYAPIEQYAEIVELRQGPWTDLYALGAVLHYLVYGAPPAPSTARAVRPDDDVIGQQEMPGISRQFMRVMSWMLRVRPVNRPQSVAAVRAALAGQADIPPLIVDEITQPALPSFDTTQHIDVTSNLFEPTQAPAQSADSAQLPASTSVPGKAPRLRQLARPGLVLAAVALVAGLGWWFTRSAPNSGTAPETTPPAAKPYTGPNLSQVTAVPQWRTAASDSAPAKPAP